MKKKLSIFLIAVATLFAGVACTDDTTTDSSNNSSSAFVGVEFKDETLALEQGDTVTLEVQSSEEKYAFTVDNDTVAVENGVLTAKKEGVATVTVTVGAYTDTLAVTVTADVIPILGIEETNPAVLVGNEYALPTYIVYKGVRVDGETFSYESKNADIATVDNAGVVKGIKAGTATVVVSSNYRFFALQKEVTVTVKENVVLTLDKEAIALETLDYKGGITEYALQAKLLIDGVAQSDTDVSWRSSDNTVVAVENGRVTWKGAGEAVVTASYAYNENTYEARCTVTVSRTKIDTGVQAEYVKSMGAFTLPAWETDDFDVDNVISVQNGGEELVVSTNAGLQLDASKCVAYNRLQQWVVITQKAEYTVDVYVWSAHVANEADMRAMTEFADRIPQGNSYVYYGNYKFVRDITLTERWAYAQVIAPMKLGSNIGAVSQNPYGFQGLIDGNNHKITGFAPSGYYIGLVGVLGENAIVKDLTLEQVSFPDVKNNAWAYRQGTIAAFVCGGTLENITVEYNVPTDLSDTVQAQTEFYTGALFANVFETSGTTYNKSVVLKNVMVKAVTNDNSVSPVTAFGVVRTIHGETEYPPFVCQNVEVIGCALFCDKAEKTTVTAYTGVSYYATYEEYASENYTVLEDVQAEAGTEIDFSALANNRKVVAVKQDGVSLGAVSTKTFAITEASDKQITFEIETENKKFYIVKVTLWSMIIDNEEELRSMNDKVYYNADGMKKEGEFNAVYGYFLLNANITLTQLWTRTQAIADKGICTPMKQYGFQGIFDGGNHTITGFTPSGYYAGLIGVLGENGIVRNVNFKGVTFRDVTDTAWAYRQGVIAAFASGGTVQNVDIEYTIPTSTNTKVEYYTGVLFGNVYETAGLSYNTQIVLKDITITITDLSATAHPITVFGVVRTKHGTNVMTPFACENVIVVGTGLYVDKNETGAKVTAMNGVTYYASMAEYNAK